jgi:predicted membrane protein
MCDNMDKNLLYLQIIFLAAVVVNLISEKQLFLKILLLLLTFLFFIKELDAYVYNRDKYLYVGIGFTSILFLFILSNYITHIYYLIFFMCVVILYLYLYKVLFNTTFGTVIKSTTKEATIKIDDPFFKTKKEYSLKYSKKIEPGLTVILELSKSFVNKKPIKIKKVILK